MGCSDHATLFIGEQHRNAIGDHDRKGDVGTVRHERIRDVRPLPHGMDVPLAAHDSDVRGMHLFDENERHPEFALQNLPTRTHLIRVIAYMQRKVAFSNAREKGAGPRQVEGPRT